MDSWTQQGWRMTAAGMFRVARFAAVAFVLSPAVAVSQESGGVSISRSTDPNPIVATRANAPMRIDGMLDEPIWRFVRPSTNFVQKDPTEGAPATLVTDVRMIITDDAVVIGARMQDDYRAVLSALGPPTDGAAGGYLDDYFEIQIDPHRQHLTSFAFNIAPSADSAHAPIEALPARGLHGYGMRMTLPLVARAASAVCAAAASASGNSAPIRTFNPPRSTQSNNSFDRASNSARVAT